MALNNTEIQKYLNSRYPFLMVDRVTELVPYKYAKGFKNLTCNEWFYPVHFPEEPMMPGMIQIEALTQMLSLTVLCAEGNAGKTVRGISADHIKLKRRVVPGDRLDIEAVLESYENGIGRGEITGTVDGEIACSADYTFRILEDADSDGEKNDE